jgi:hypothetical protein
MMGSSGARVSVGAFSIADGLVRVSVGIEDWRALLADFEQDCLLFDKSFQRGGTGDAETAAQNKGFLRVSSAFSVPPRWTAVAARRIRRKSNAA